MFELFGSLARGVDAIVEEVRTSGTADDVECLEYVLNQRAGSSDKLFDNSPHARDRDAHGVRHDRIDKDGQGMVLADFVAHPNAQTAKLTKAHVVALRLYSTAAYRSLNGPLRDRQRTCAHPFAATIFFLADGIKKLRTVEAEKEPNAENGRRRSDAKENTQELWRGMRNLQTAKEFLEQGGTEAALMSTTRELEVAVAYALSPHSLLFKIRTPSFMQRGADIQFLSAFPAESEMLFPPLTFLKPTKKNVDVVKITPHMWGGGGATVTFTVVEVEPQVA